jgi:hypothetical protein
METTAFLPIPSTKATVITIAEWGDSDNVGKGDLVLYDGALEVISSLRFLAGDYGRVVFESALHSTVYVFRHDKVAVIRYAVEG